MRGKSNARVGRPQLPDGKRKVLISFRAEPELAEALRLLADSNSRTVSSETLFQVETRLRELGKLNK